MTLHGNTAVVLYTRGSILFLIFVGKIFPPLLLCCNAFQTIWLSHSCPVHLQLVLCQLIHALDHDQFKLTVPIGRILLMKKVRNEDYLLAYIRSKWSLGDLRILMFFPIMVSSWKT